MRHGYFGLESDCIEEEDIIVDRDESAYDDVDDDIETVDTTPTVKETAHNEAASAGGVLTESNENDISIDPVAATETFLRRNFGFSREDIEEAIAETEAAAAELPNADTGLTSADEELYADDPEAEAIGMTTVVVKAPEGGSVEPGDLPAVDAGIETSADVATLEGLRRIWSVENEEDPVGNEAASDGLEGDVEFDVKTPNNDVNFLMDNKAITIEPNEEGGYEGGDTSYEPQEGAEEPQEGAEEPQEGAEEPQEGAEGWFAYF